MSARNSRRDASARRGCSRRAVERLCDGVTARSSCPKSYTRTRGVNSADEPLTSSPSQSGKTKQLYKGHLGPVTSLDFYTVPSSPPREVLVSGSWDKSFRVWDTQVRLRRTRLGRWHGSTDRRFFSTRRQKTLFRLLLPTPTLSKLSS